MTHNNDTYHKKLQHISNTSFISDPKGKALIEHTRMYMNVDIELNLTLLEDGFFALSTP